MRLFTSQIGIHEVTAPAVPGLAFIGRTGWVGVHCSCGFLVSGRSMAGLEHALADHQEPAFCPAWAEHRKAEAEAE